MTTIYSEKAVSFTKALDNLEKQVDSRIGFQVDDDYILGLKSRLDIIKTKIENTRQQFKKDVTKLVTKNIENKQNVVIKNWGKTEIDFPRISEMDEKIKMINELKKMSQMSIPEKINLLKTRLKVVKVINKANKNTYAGRRNDILDTLERIENSLKNNKILNNKSRQTIDQKLNTIQKSIDKLFDDFKKEFQKYYTKIMNSNRSSRMIKTYLNFYKPSNSQPFIGSKTRIVFSNKKIPTIDKWDNILSTLKKIVNKPTVPNKPTAPNKEVKGISLLKKNYDVVPIKGDGACQFRAVAAGMKQVLGNSVNIETTAKNIRNATVASLRNKLENDFNSLKSTYIQLYVPPPPPPPKLSKSGRKKGFSVQIGGKRATAKPGGKRATTKPQTNNNNTSITNETARTMLTSYINGMSNSCTFGDMLTLGEIMNFLKTGHGNIELVVLNQTSATDDYYQFHVKGNVSNSYSVNQIRYIYLLLTQETNTFGGHYDLLIRKQDPLNSLEKNVSKLTGKI